MMAAQVFLGVSLLVLLIGDTCGFPMNGPSPRSGNKKAGAYPAEYSYPEYTSNANQFSGSSAPATRVSQPAGWRQPAAPVASSSRVVESGPPPSFPDAGTAANYGPQDVDWVVDPPGVFSGREEPDTVSSSGFVSGGPDATTQALPPPGPMYQGGELYHYENIAETGDHESETEEIGYQPPPPPPPPMSQFAAPESTGPQQTSEPRPPPGPGGYLGYPYHYYDYMFLMGLYPPGTVSHFSQDYEQGRDYWHDDHYIKYYEPYIPAPVMQTKVPVHPVVPEVAQNPKQPVKTPGKAAGGQAGFYGYQSTKY